MSAFFRGPVKSLVLGGSGELLVTGVTSKTAFLATPGAYQTQFNGGNGGATLAARLDLTVSPSGPEFTCAANAASLIAGHHPEFPNGEVAPGEILIVAGNGFTPGSKVTFGGFSAPILYEDANQILTVVPFELEVGSTSMWIETAQQSVGPVALPVVAAVPGVFATTGTGQGQAAVLNGDGTVNSSAHPAKAGSVVAVFLTGAGRMIPAIADGEPGPLSPPYPVPELRASASVANTPAPVLFAGQAPGLIAGAVQVNLRIPETTPTVNAYLIVYFGDYASEGRTTVAVQQ